MADFVPDHQELQKALNEHTQAIRDILAELWDAPVEAQYQVTHMKSHVSLAIDTDKEFHDARE